MPSKASFNAVTVTALSKAAREHNSTKRQGTFVLDRDYMILQAATNTGFLEEHIGECLWDALPPLGAETWFPIYRRAWENGKGSGVGFYSGILTKATMEVAPGGATMAVAYEEIARLDVTNLRTVRQTLNAILARLEIEEHRAGERVQQSRSETLRVVPEPVEAPLG